MIVQWQVCVGGCDVRCRLLLLFKKTKHMSMVLLSAQCRCVLPSVFRLSTPLLRPKIKTGSSLVYMFAPVKSDLATNVSSLSAVRSVKKASALKRTVGRTLVVQVEVVCADRTIMRQLGINSDMSFSQLYHVLAVAFNFSHQAPCLCERDGFVVDFHEAIGNYLTDFSDCLCFHWGLWLLNISVIETIPRDATTPDALCIGGVGSFDDAVFLPADISSINAALTGDAAIDEILGLARSGVADVIRRSSLYDFVPLLQAIDFSRMPAISPEVAMVCAVLPVEENPRSREAFWVCVLALSCISDAEQTDYVIEAITTALGWPEHITVAATKQLCATSLKQLETIGAYGTHPLSAVERIDIYRELLRG